MNVSEHVCTGKQLEILTIALWSQGERYSRLSGDDYNLTASI